MLINEKQIKRVVIKIGSSSLTSMHGEISRRKLEKFAEQIVELKDVGYETAVVSSGAVAAGYRKLGCLDRPSSLPEKQAAASIGQGLLMESYSELFLSHGYVASQILITRSDFSDEKRYGNMHNTMNVLLERGIIPIINENDTVTVDRLRFGDNDTMAAKVAGLIDADLLIILSDIDGLYDSNPNDNSHATLLERVHSITPEIEAAAGGSGSAAGTGGMKSKIQAVKIAMAAGIDSFLGKAGTENILMEAVESRARGTYFTPEPDAFNLDNEKQWIAFHSGPEGKVTINSHGIEAIVDHQENLYCSDIREVKGRLKDGAVVRILDEEGKEIGLGRINYSNEQLSGYIADEVLEPAIAQETFVCSRDFKLPALV